MDNKHAVGLCWFFLPLAIWQEIVYYLIEPMVVMVIDRGRDLLPLTKRDSDLGDSHHLLLCHRQYPWDGASFGARQTGDVG